MTTTSWADLNRDGRRLEGIIKQLNTKIHKNPEDKNYIPYINSLVKLTYVKMRIAHTILGIDEILKDAPKDREVEWQALYQR